MSVIERIFKLITQEGGLSMQKPRKLSIGTRILSSLYIGAVAFIIIRDIPKGTFNTLNTLVIIYVVLFNAVLSVNIARLAIKRVVFTKLSALYIAALAGFIMTISTGKPTGVPLTVFGLSLLYIGVYTVVLAIRGILTGRV
jgi:hypothetical protein